MKITQIYIENFGKHSKLQFTFQENITQFLKQNGFGKTTFAAFLKAMFYGLPSIRQNTKEFNDRQHYAPFNSGKFGGNISFIYNGNHYTIERFFDKKSETKDTLKVYCNDKEYNGFSAEIGKELFHLDKESFERTTFITTTILDSITTADIEIKLRQFINNTTTECNIATALLQLEKVKKEYKLHKGQGGKIYTLTCRKQSCYQMLENLDIVESKLEEEYLQYNQLRLELKQLNDNIAVTTKLERYTEYQEKIQALQEKMQAIQIQYKNGLPTLEEFDKLKLYANKLQQLETILQQTSFSPVKVERLQKLQRELSPLPHTITLEEMQKNIQLHTTKQAELAAYKNTLNCTKKGQEAADFTSSQTNKKKFTTILSLFFLILGMGAIVATTFLTKNIGFFTLIGGILFFISALIIIFFSNKKQKRERTQSFAISSNIAENRQNEEIEHTSTISILEDEYNSYTQTLQQFFRHYGYIGNDFLQYLTDLYYKIQEYNSLQQEWDDNLKNFEELNSQIIDIKAKIDTLLQPFAIEIQQNFLQQLDNLQETVQQLDQFKKQLSAEQIDAKNYAHKYNLTAFFLQNTIPNNNMTLANIEEKRQKYAHLTNSIAELEQQLASRTTYENELENIENELKICQEEYALLTATIQYLQQAEENLKNRYLQPLRSKLNTYNIQQILGITIQLNSDLNLTFESNGERHSNKHLSTGQRTLCLFILRLALIDCLFPQENDKPLLILDDPFVNLDANYMENCTKILHEIAKNRQIIYFCCHASRKII